MHRSVLVLSRHDIRNRTQVSIQFIARALAEVSTEVNFVSVAFSPLSRRAFDERWMIADRANRWERVDGINAYLWRMPWHPMSVGGPALRRLTGAAFDVWSRWPCRALDEAARRADLIVVESGPSPALLPRLRRLNPTARIVYFAADLLDAALVHPRVQAILDASAPLVDKVIVVARAMIPHFAAFDGKVQFLRHGLDPAVYGNPGPSPYAGGVNIVSIGSMLFDAAAVRAAAEGFPDATFHLIGTPPGHAFPPNVREYGPMPFADTIPWLSHADAGIAPYRPAAHVDYLVDSSLKLMQFGALGVPAVAPHFAVGDRPMRFGYDAAEPATIRSALREALAVGDARVRVPSHDWREFVRRLEDPTAVEQGRMSADTPDFLLSSKPVVHDESGTRQAVDGVRLQLR